MVEAQDAHGSVSSVTRPLTEWVWGGLGQVTETLSVSVSSSLK